VFLFILDPAIPEGALSQLIIIFLYFLNSLIGQTIFVAEQQKNLKE